MGTSLNGLTPAGTYPGLIKTGDNAPIDGTLKTLSDGNGNNLPMAVSTTAVNFTNQLQQSGVAVPTASQVAAKQDTLVSGTNIKTINGTSVLGSGNIVTPTTSPSGVAGAIQFSNGSAFASDAANFFWDDTNNRLGIGTNVPTSALEVASDAKINGLTVGLGGGSITTNTAFGSDALDANTTGIQNTAIGYQALRVSTGVNNTAVGSQSLFRNTTGINNTGLGLGTLIENTTGGNNSAFGLLSLNGNITGSSNTAIGRSALQQNTASNNTALGAEAALSNTSGTGITAIGYQALRASTGANNTALGFEAGDNITTGAGNVCIGSGAEPENATDSNKFVVGTASVNAGAVTAETITPDRTWTVRINGANYKIPMLAL